MGRIIDLHTHSQCSDGALSPAALAAAASRAGLRAIAITDHDTLDGLAAAAEAGRALGIEVVPGVEISCELAGREAHIVGLFISPHDKLCERLAQLRRNRQIRMARMLEKLNCLGIDIALSDLKVQPASSCGRPHLAEALVAKGAARDIADAFQRFLGDGAPAYVAKQRLAVDEAVVLIHDAGGLAILAHPGPNGWLPDLQAFIPLGLDGVEVYSPKHGREAVRRAQQFCQVNGLAASGGSDFHGNGDALGVEGMSDDLLEELRSRLQRLRR